jgi:hypothetical protein
MEIRGEKMGIFDKLFGRKKGERVTSGVSGGELWNIGRKAVQPKCSICGRIITMQATSIAEDIRRSGGVAIGGSSLGSPMYACTICPACGSAFCLSCQRPSPDPCPKCGKSNLRPGFADLVHKYYRG